MKVSKITVFMMFLTPLMPIDGVELGHHINFGVGYRSDDYHTAVQCKSVPPDPVQNPAVNGIIPELTKKELKEKRKQIKENTLYFKEKIELNSLDLTEVGVNGRWVVPQNDTLDFSFLNDCYIEGFSYIGFHNDQGNYSKRLTVKKLEVDIQTKARVKDAKTYDMQLGLGYQLLNFQEWGFALSGGYSYDGQRIDLKNGKTKDITQTEFIVDPTFDSYKMTRSWQGPWIGGELFYQIYALTFGCGYEYHFSDYHVKFKIPNQSTTIKGKTGHGHGNIGFVECRYLFWGGWQIGAAFKYQYWIAKELELKSVPKSANYPITTKFRDTLSTCSLVADIGYTF